MLAFSIHAMIWSLGKAFEVYSKYEHLEEGKKIKQNEDYQFLLFKASLAMMILDDNKDLIFFGYKE